MNGVSMYFIALSLLAIISGFLWYRNRESNRYRLDILSLISGGATVMFLVDSLYRYLEEGIFIEFSTEALTLSGLLVLVAVSLWLVVLIIKRIQIKRI